MIPKTKYTNLNNNDSLNFYNDYNSNGYYDLISIIYKDSGYSLNLQIYNSALSFSNPPDINRYQLKTETINKNDVSTEYSFRIKIEQ